MLRDYINKLNKMVTSKKTNSWDYQAFITIFAEHININKNFLDVVTTKNYFEVSLFNTPLLKLDMVVLNNIKQHDNFESFHLAYKKYILDNRLTIDNSSILNTFEDFDEFLANNIYVAYNNFFKQFNTKTTKVVANRDILECYRCPKSNNDIQLVEIDLDIFNSLNDYTELCNYLKKETYQTLFNTLDDKDNIFNLFYEDELASGIVYYLNERLALKQPQVVVTNFDIKISWEEIEIKKGITTAYFSLKIDDSYTNTEFEIDLADGLDTLYSKLIENI